MWAVCDNALIADNGVIAFNALTLLVGCQEEHLACKNIE